MDTAFQEDWSLRPRFDAPKVLADFLPRLVPMVASLFAGAVLHLTAVPEPLSASF
jgi:hypothetical protein